jgi:AcrR family transcriptional regulator
MNKYSSCNQEDSLPRVTEAHLHARRRQILTAASRCFSRSGFHDATMQEIADEAGLSAGALYRYFDGKDGLVEALAAWGREQKRDALQELSAGGGPDGLARLVEAMLATLASDGATEAARLDVRLWGEALGQPRLRRLAKRELQGLIGPIAGYLRGEAAAGRVRSEVDPDALARAVVALLMGLELQKAFEPRIDTQRISGAVGVLLSGLATRSGPGVG